MCAYLPSGRASNSSSAALSLELLVTSFIFKRAVLNEVESSLLGGVGEVDAEKVVLV